MRGHAVENVLIGTELEDAVLDTAAEAASTLVSDDMSDVHATIEYRRVLTAELTRRVLQAAWQRRGH